MLKTMLTSATQQRNLQGNLQRNSQGNPQSETPPISIETSPIVPIIDAGIIFSLRFTARIKRISVFLIMSVLMVFLSACGGGGGGGDDDIAPSGGDPISVSNLRVFPDVSSAILMWDNPDADIQHIDIMYTTGAAANLETRYRVTDPSKIVRAEKNVTQIISGLTATNYTFNIHLELKGSNENKPVEAVSITRLIGPNLDGDEYADDDPLDPDSGGGNDGGNGGGGGGGGDPITTPTKFTVIELEATPGNMKVTLSWTNPAAQIANISINYGITNSADQIDPIIITNSTQLIAGDSVEQVIPDLTNGQSYNFTVSLALNGTDAGKEGAVQSVTTTLASDAIPPPLTTGISVSNLRVFPDESSAMLMWNNPDADIQHIEITYEANAADSFETRRRVTVPSKTASGKKNVTQIISGLTAANYTFNIHLELKGSDADKPVEVVSITRLIGPNLDGDEYADADPLEFDIDGDDVNNTMDAFPSDPNESVDTDGDTVGDNADVDADGDGLIEIATAQQLNQSRHNLLGSSFTRSADDEGDANGCGNGTMGGDITACNGYELIADIYLTTYANWQPIGSCMSYDGSSGDCTPTIKFFNAIFDGNNHTINDLTITNPAGSYANAAGLFGAISSTSILRNIHIRSGNISDGGNNVGLLVGHARGASIINSSAEGAVAASANNVGGLVGFGFGATIMSSYAAGGSVSGDHSVGGLVGNGQDAEIMSSYAAGGAVSGTAHNIGGLVGYGFGATITSSYAAGGAVSGDGNNVGGLVGDGEEAEITSSYAAGGDVSGTGSAVGGLVGYGRASTITSSYAAGGNVSGDFSVGGLVGEGQSATITSSYAAGGAVIGTGDDVGGLVGYGRRARITSSYAAGGDVSGASNVGGLVGFGRGSTITASYWDDAVTIIPSTGNSYGLPKTTSELQAPVHATGIYATWTSLCPGTNKPAWYFGTSTQYPVLTCHPNSDSDRDGVPDIRDTDDDNDGTLDTADALPLNPTEDTDTDNDGVGDNADAFPTDGTLSAFAVTELRAAAGVGNVTLSWNNPNNPDVQIASIDISYKRTGTNDVPMTISSTKTTSGATNVEQTITGLTNGQSYTFTVSLTLMDPNAGMVGPAPSTSATPFAFAVTGLYGIAGADYVTLSWNNPDAQIGSISISHQVSGPGNPRVTTTITDSPKIDANETVKHNISGLTPNAYYDFTVSLRLSDPDAGKEGAPPTIRVRVNADYDGDGKNNFVDVDVDGDGLIEIATAQQLNQSRHNLLGSSFTRSAGGVGDANGCGNGGSVTECNGYELVANIYLADYSDWQPIGRCTTSAFDCTPVNELFNATFDGNSHTINDLTITNHDGSYDNTAGLFGAISPTSILRNIHIRSGNISDGGHNVGLLVGYARGASIINSSAEGAVDASGDNVGGLVGDGSDANITSSYAAGGAVSGANNVGGLVGFGATATITSSYAAGGSVSGLSDVGGLVGEGGGSMTITSSYAAGGAVSGINHWVGGLVGDGSFSTITSSYAAGGSVSGTGDDVGGLVGYGHHATITSSYAAGGDVSGAGGDVGGLVGVGNSNTVITASYWDSEKSGQSSSFGGGDAKTTEELKAGADGIYSTWAAGTCADGITRIWDFGTASDYPALRCTPNGLPAQEHLRQR